MTASNDERRRQMLDRIRSGVNEGRTVKARADTSAARLQAQAPHLIPERAKKDAAGLRALFSEHLKGQSAAVIDVASDAEIPAAIAAYLRNANQPMRLRMGDDERLARLPWSTTPALSLEQGPIRETFDVALSHAAVGVAETGTLVMSSGSANPVTLNYLPENHIVVIRARDIAGAYETAFERLRSQLGRGTMPRTLNFISGPSRSADIGGRPVLGAHGPRQLCVIIVGD